MTSWVVTLLAVLVVVEAFFIAGLMIQVAKIERQLGPYVGAVMPKDGLLIGTDAPDFSAKEKRTGQTVKLSDYAGRDVLLLFLSPRCRACRELVPHLNRLAEQGRRPPIVVVATDGPGVDYARELDERITVVGDPNEALLAAYQVGRTPLAYVLDGERRVTNRTVPNKLTDLEETLEGLGRPMGTAAWVPMPAEANEITPNGEAHVEASTGQERGG